MTDVAFHLNVEDRMAYACRLLRKAYVQRARTWVVLSPQELAELDRALWLMSQKEFLAHGRDSSPPHVQRHSPIVLGTEANAPEGFDVLVNLGGALRSRPQAFHRIIEIVGASGEQKDGARERWRQYRSWGMEPTVAIDLAKH